MTDKKIMQFVNESIECLRINELEIIKRDISEMAITHKLAEYLQKRITNYDVDVEYNRNIDKPKEYIHGKKGLPDIIVHKRLTNENNILIVELKKQNNTNKEARKTDEKKLKAFTLPRNVGGYGFKLGLFIDIHIKDWNKLICVWYKNGEKLRSMI